MDTSLCVFSISACLQDELLCFYGLSEMVHSSLIACIKMGVSLTNPKQQAAIPFFGHTKILHMLVSMGSTALAASVVLPRYGGLNYACGINEDQKRKKFTLHNLVQCSCKHIEQKCFIYHQMYHGN